MYKIYAAEIKRRPRAQPFLLRGLGRPSSIIRLSLSFNYFNYG